MKLRFDPIDQKWSLRYGGSFYLWEGDPFHRAAAEAFARKLVARIVWGRGL